MQNCIKNHFTHQQKHKPRANGGPNRPPLKAAKTKLLDELYVAIRRLLDKLRKTQKISLGVKYENKGKTKARLKQIFYENKPKKRILSGAGGGT